MDATSHDLAYFAGLIDGEGSFSISVGVRKYKERSSVWFNPRMSMTLKWGNEVLDELARVFGGAVYDHMGVDTRAWVCGKRQFVLPAAEALLPYLRIKHTTCTRFLEALYRFPKRKGHGTGQRSWDMDTAMAVAEIALTLNERSMTKGLNRVMLQDIRAIYENEHNTPYTSEELHAYAVARGVASGAARRNKPAVFNTPRYET
jgi:hypothetical protein